MAANIALAGNGISDTGKHANINIIGHPNATDDEEPNLSEWGGGNSSESGGSSIFIPLVTQKKPKNGQQVNGEFVCTDPGTGVQTVYTDDPPNGLAYDEEPDGKTRIYFDPVTSGKVEITDRDGTDGAASIDIPVDGNGEVTVDLYVRVLGKPGGCAEISGYAYEADSPGDPGELWWYAGSVELTRKGGKSEFINATEIFYVRYCADPIVLNEEEGTWECDGNAVRTSVFDRIFQDYFWEVNNYNTKLIQMRLYY
jgi:hypothetical protein